MAETIVPSTDPAALLAALPPDAPVVMINLLQFAQPDGAARYARYAQQVAPYLANAGGRVIYAGDAKVLVIGDTPRPWWDAILVVEYPAPAAFLDMVSAEGYADVHAHRAAALERAELIATASWGL